MKDKTTTLAEYQQKKEELMRELLFARQQGAPIGLGGKKTSNLFRDRNQKGTQKINVRNFNKVIGVDVEKMEVEVEGMTTYEDLVNATLPYHLLPAVVPQLKSITVGGAVTGVGIEATSFKYGFVHETVTEMEVLLSNGTTVVCTPHNEHKDLFFGFPNSYGTLGYALKIKLKLIPAGKFVKVTHTHYSDPQTFFKDLKESCQKAKLVNSQETKPTVIASERSERSNLSDIKEMASSPELVQAPRHDNTPTFIDGVVFDKDNLYLSQGSFVNEAPYASNYKYMKIYYRSLCHKNEDYLTTLDYIWRWDPDWFWCSKAFGMQNPVLRLLLGKFCLKSTVYWKVKNFMSKHGFFALLEKLAGKKEAVIQDVEIPIGRCSEFLDFFHQNIGIKPVWICPASAFNPKVSYDLYTMDPHELYVNFGFWDAVKTTHPQGYFNRLVEEKVKNLNGRKSLYSDSFYSEKEFWELYNRPSYEQLKTKYDPTGAFKDLYTKCVLRR